MAEKAMKLSTGKGKVKSPTTAKQRTLLDMFSKSSPRREAAEDDSGATTNGLQSKETSADTSSTLPAIEGQGVDPIVIEDTPPPEMPPTSAPPTDAANSPISVYDFTSEDTGSSPSVPIVIDSSPIKASAFNPRSKTVHPFFAAKAPARSTPVPSAFSKPQTWSTPYPDAQSQHVKGPQTLTMPCKNPLSAGAPKTAVPDLALPESPPLSSYSFLCPGLGKPPIQSRSEWQKALEPCQMPITELAGTIPAEHIARHPAIVHTVDQIGARSSSHSSGEVWTEKWRPRSADQVLGNEQSALYLRKWLLALKLQAEVSPPNEDRPSRKQIKSSRKGSKKRPRVITEIGKGRVRKRVRTDSDEDEDCWIVYSEEEEVDELNLMSSDPFLDHIAPPTVLPSNRTLQHEAIQDLGELHNTILLSGPPGTGKTASVYACAEELGWEVFEVYPGIGKRNGSNIELLVGEVGKNHLVRHRPMGQGCFTLASPTKRRRTLDISSHTSRGDIPSLREGPAKGNDPQTPDDDQPPEMAQSLILLEEVDVLFKEDTNFWSTVIKIIKECKRPVICTCNDISLVPLSDLPIQKVLEFVPCSPTVTVSYLQSVIYAEGRPIPRQGLESFLETRRSGELVTGDGKRLAYDLRHAINLLQVLLNGSPPQLDAATTLPDGGISFNNHLAQAPQDSPAGDTKESVLAQWRRVAHEAETRSFLDTYLGRDLTGVPSIEETYAPSDDDEIGHAILFEKQSGASLPIAYSRHEQMRLVVEELVESKVGARASLMATIESETEMLLVKTNRFQSDLHHVLVEVCPLSVWKSRLPHLYLDYGPYIRQVAEADDAQAEAMIQRVQERGGRKTRNSGLAEYVRTLRLSDLGRSSLSRICYEC